MESEKRRFLSRRATAIWDLGYQETLSVLKGIRHTSLLVTMSIPNLSGKWSVSEPSDASVASFGGVFLFLYGGGPLRVLIIRALLFGVCVGGP